MFARPAGEAKNFGHCGCEGVENRTVQRGCADSTATTVGSYAYRRRREKRQRRFSLLSITGELHTVATT